MSKAETAEKLFESNNCAQSVLAAYAADYNLEKEKALQVALGFGAGMGRLQETCGAVTGAFMVLGLAGELNNKDAIYAKVRAFAADFSSKEKSIKCRDLLGCDLLTEDGQKIFKDQNLKNKCTGYVRLCCELLDKHLEKQ